MIFLCYRKMSHCCIFGLPFRARCASVAKGEMTPLLYRCKSAMLYWLGSAKVKTSSGTKNLSDKFWRMLVLLLLLLR